MTLKLIQTTTVLIILQKLIFASPQGLGDISDTKFGAFDQMYGVAKKKFFGDLSQAIQDVIAKTLNVGLPTIQNKLPRNKFNEFFIKNKDFLMKNAASLSSQPITVETILGNSDDDNLSPRATLSDSNLCDSDSPGSNYSDQLTPKHANESRKTDTLAPANKEDSYGGLT